jgi:hypothetical protein
MRIHAFKFLFLFCLVIPTSLAFAQDESTQYDDIYFDGVEIKQAKKVQNANTATNSQDIEVFDDEIAASETVPEGSLPEEYYIDENLEPYDYEYASRVRRFHNTAPGFSYYSNYYTDNYWYNNNQSYHYGSNIYTNPNYAYYNGWGNNCYTAWNNHYGFNQPYNYSYNSWNNGGWNNSYGNFNGFYGHYHPNWNSYYGNNSNYWGYNFANSSPNAGSYVVQRTRRGNDVVRNNTVHTSRQPDSRMVTESVQRNRNAVNGPRPSTTNTTSTSTDSRNAVQNTRRPNVANSSIYSTGVRSGSTTRTTTRNSYNNTGATRQSTSTRSNTSTNTTRGYNPTRSYHQTKPNYGARSRSNHTPRSNTNTRSSSSSSSSRTGSTRSNSSSSRNSSKPRR